MGTLINAQIDVTKIDKSKLKDGKYYNLTIEVNDKPNEFNGFLTNVAITEAQTKEQRDAEEKKHYLGNGRVFWTKGEPKVCPFKVDAPEANIETYSQGQTDDSLPF